MNKFKNSKIVGDMFTTIRPATAGLILGAMSSVMAYTLLNIDNFNTTGSILDLIRLVPFILFVVYLLVLYKFKKIHPIAIIASSAVLGIIFKL